MTITLSVTPSQGNFGFTYQTWGSNAGDIMLTELGAMDYAGEKLLLTEYDHGDDQWL